MENGLGELGFWLAVGMVVAAVIVSGALKERDRERERQAALRALPEQGRERQELLSALLEKGGENTTEVLAYLRERDAAIAARAEAMMHRKRTMSGRQQVAFVGAVLVGVFSFIGGLAGSETQNHPASPRFVFSPQAGHIIPEFPPPPTGLDALLPLGPMLGIWAAGLVIAVLIVIWGGFGKQKHDAQPDA